MVLGDRFRQRREQHLRVALSRTRRESENIKITSILVMMKIDRKGKEKGGGGERRKGVGGEMRAAVTLSLSLSLSHALMKGG